MPLPDLAVGCSGGSDSLALTLLAAEWARARGGRCLALVADHGLRERSGEEARSVTAQLAARGIPARVLRLCLPPGPRLQERARAARRSALLAACAAEGLAQLLLAHHAGDQRETVLFRALRGSFTRGLAGMAPVVVAAEALILRPLLGVEPARLRATCIARGAAPLEDPSNQDGRYARTRLRLAPRGDPLPAASALASRRAREDAGVATRLALAARLFPAGCAWLDLALLGSDRTARLALARLLAGVGAAAHAPGEREATALLAAGRGTLGGARLLPGGRWLVREAAALAPPVPATPGVTWDRRFRLRGGVPPGLRLGALGPAPRLRQLAPHLPAAALAALPALLSSDGTPALVPHLRWPSPEACATLALDFVAGEMQIMPVSGYGMPHYLRTEPADGRREDHAT